MNPRPLSDEELDEVDTGPKPSSETMSRMWEQAKRANALARAVAFAIQFSESSTTLRDALASYLGDKDPWTP